MGPNEALRAFNRGDQGAHTVDDRNPTSPYISKILPDIIWFWYMSSIEGHAGFLSFTIGSAYWHLVWVPGLVGKGSEVWTPVLY